MISSLRPKATSEVSQKWKRKTFRKCFLQLIHKVGHTQLFQTFTFHFLWTLLTHFFIFPPSSAVSVLERMLLLDPQSRVTAAEALTLPYFSEFREPEEETEAQPYDHSLDNTDLPLDQWKRKDGWGLGWGAPSGLQGNQRDMQMRDDIISEGRRAVRAVKFYQSLSCCSSFLRSHFHRDLDLQTSCARFQGNLTVIHKEMAEQPGTRTN